MIDEREVFDRFHEALDVQPGPGAFDRLQVALTQRPVRPSRRTTLVLPVPRLGLRLAAAGMIVLVLTLAVAGAFLALRLTASRTAPAKPSTTTLTGQLYPGYPRMVTPTTGWLGVVRFGWTNTHFFRTTDGGATWQSVRPPGVNDAIASVRASYFLDGDHAWIAAAVLGTSLTVFATADGGRTWTAGAPVPSGYEPGGPNGGLDASKLDFLDDRVGWLRTSSGPGRHTLKLYGTTDGGRTWRLILEAADSDGSTLAKLGQGCFEDELKFVSANLGWMSYNCAATQPAGQPGSGSPAPGPVVAVTKDGGRSWQQVALPQFATGHNLCSTTAPVFYNSGNVVLAGYCFKSIQATGGVYVPELTDIRVAIFVSSDAGLTWSLRPVPPGVSPPAFIDANTGWSIRWNGDVFHTSDGGLTWQLIGSFHGDPDFLWSLQVFDTNNALVTGADANPKAFVSGSLLYWRTTDGGRTWVEVKRPSPSS